jgi:hypothetical protein
MAKLTPGVGISFSGSDDNAVLSALEAWEAQVFKDASTYRPDLEKRLKFRSTVPLELLPIETQKTHMAKYRNIIGFDNVLSDISGGPSSDIGVGVAERASRSGFFSLRGSKKKQYGGFVVDPSDRSALGHIYNQMNVQYGKPYSGSNLGIDYFSVGRSTIPTSKSVRSGMRSAAGGFTAGASFTVFDIETAGLDFGGIHEVSYRGGIVGEGQTFGLAGSTTTERFRVGAFNRGMRMVKGQPLTAEEYMSKKFGVDWSKAGRVGNGDDFADRMVPFLRRMQESQYILGHNISRFDIQQVFVGLSGTSRYNTDAEFRSLVDDTYSSIDSKIVDTLTMARDAPNLRGIATAKELAKLGSSERYSISNILLQTDFLEKASPELIAMIDNGAGLHMGDVDAAVTAKLAELIPSLQVRSGGIGSDAFRSGVTRAAAIIPITDIRDISEVSDNLLRQMLRSGDGIKTKSPVLRNAIAKIGTPGKANAKVEKAVKMIRSGKYDVSIKANPLEQEIATTRNFALRSQTGLDMDSRLLAMGKFDRFTGRKTPYGGSIRKKFGAMVRTTGEPINFKTFAEFQQRAVEGGLPYAGLSYEERKISSALSNLTTEMAGPHHAQKAAKIGTDSLISHFNNYDSFYVSTRNERVRAGIPLAILDALDPDSARTVTISPYRAAAQDSINPVDKYGVNLVYNFKDQKHLDRIIGGIDSLPQRTDAQLAEMIGVDLGTPEGVRAVQKLRADIPSVVARLRSQDALSNGVSVAKVNDSSVARRMYDLIKEARGGLETDDGALGFRAQIIDRNASRTRVGAFVADRFLDGPSLGQLAERTEEARVYLDDFVGNQVLGSRRDRLLASRIVNNTSTDEGARKALRAADNVSKAVPYVKKGAAVAGLAAVGYYMFKKYQENQMLEEPMQQMPYEVGTNYSLNSQIMLRMAAGENGAKYMDPLATAPLVGNLYDNRIGHGDMSWDRNSSLYGGVL